MRNSDCTELNTERLYLRTLTEADAETVQAVFPGEYASTGAAREHIRWILNSGYDGRLVINFYVWLADTEECIGRVYLHSKPELGGEVEIGYGIAEKHRGKGYATEAARAVVRYAFEQAGQKYLVAIVKPENVASRKVITAIGFTKREDRVVEDENGVDCAFDFFRLEREEWRLDGK